MQLWFLSQQSTLVEHFSCNPEHEYWGGFAPQTSAPVSASGWQKP